MNNESQLDRKIAKELKRFTQDPLGYVMFSFPWDSNPAIQVVRLAEGPDEKVARLARAKGLEPPKPILTDADRTRQAAYRAKYKSKYGPDLWACDFLVDLGAKIKDRAFDGHTAVMPVQYAIASGHGIGKSVLVAWLIKFIMDTRPFSKGVVTAGTADQLKTKTWAELGKWHKMSITRNWFTYTSGRGAMALAHAGEHKEIWRCDAQTCKEENSESFAGLHAANATPFYIFDEASGVPDKIYEVREGGTTDGEPMTFDFGNPTRNSGRFFEQCAGTLREFYHVRQIDSRQVAITNKERIAQWIKAFGEDSDFVKVRVRGVFPSAGAVQFIGSADVDMAQAREVKEDRFSQLIIGVDVARFGDDESVIFSRIGNDCRSFPAQRFRGLDTVQLVGRVIETVRDFKARGLHVAGLFVDGTGLGGGVVDQLAHLGYPVTEVQFGSSPTDGITYRYKSDEMWGKMRDAIVSRLCLPKNNEPNGNDLRRDLTQREFGYTLTGNKIHLETKRAMKERGINSPDIADALALTFAETLMPSGIAHGEQAPQTQAKSDYDPYADA